MQNFAITLLTCSITMSAIALLYMAILPLLAKRYSKKGLYYTWLIVVIGLIIPFRPSWNNAIFKVIVPSDISFTIDQRMLTTNNVMTTSDSARTSLIHNVEVSPSILHISWWQIAAVTWLVGMLIFLTYHLTRHYRFLQMTRRWNEDITNEHALSLFQDLKSEMGITKRIEFYKCSCVVTPLVIGFIRPRIFLPTSELALDELRCILNHELVHYKRKDLLYKYLEFVATAVHWFNPVIYLIARSIDLLCEMSCDEEIVLSADTDIRQLYSETIIGVVKHQSKSKTALSTNFYGGKKGLKNRILSIIDTRKKKGGIFIVCIALIVTLGTGFTLSTEQRVDVGAEWLLIAAPEDYVENPSQEHVGTFYHVEIPLEQRECFDAETVRLLRELMSGKFFRADGEPFDVFAPVPGTDLYRADDRGEKIYSLFGDEVAMIYYIYYVGNDEPHLVSFGTIQTLQEQKDLFNSSFEEAEGFIGCDLQLPAVYADAFGEPRVLLQDNSMYPELNMSDNRKLAFVWLEGEPGIYYVVEKARDEDTMPSFERYIAGALIEERTIGKTTVFKSTTKDSISYFWSDDGIVYTLVGNPNDPNEFSDEQFTEIIRSMIR